MKRYKSIKLIWRKRIGIKSKKKGEKKDKAGEKKQKKKTREK